MKLNKKHGGIIFVVVALVVGYFIWKKMSASNTPSNTTAPLYGGS